MRILILHQNRYYKVKYDTAIDHDVHDVHYAGTAEYLAQIPNGLRCETCLLDPKNSIKEQLREWVRAHGPFDRVLTRQENLLMTSAELREEFGIPGLRPDEMILFRDKVKMKDAILEAGIRAPRYCKVERDLRALPWSGKTILKPRDGAGSQGVRLFPTPREAISHIQETGAALADHAYFSNYEPEEFLEGPIWHVDGYLFDGNPVAVLTSKYVGTCLDYNSGSCLGSIQFDNPALAAWALDCLRALNARSLTFHLEAIITAEGPAFLEVAGRAGGGDIVETFERATGIHLHVLDMASDVNKEVATPHARASHNGKKYGFFIIPGHQLEGAPCRVLGVDGLLQAPIVEDYRVLPAGSPTPKKPTYQAHDVPLSGVISSPDSGELESWMRQLFANVRVVPAQVAGAETTARDTDNSGAECESKPSSASSTAMYHRGNRELQALFGTARLADRLENVEARGTLTAEDQAFIAGMPMFFLATADDEGRPLCAYKGGVPGFVNVLDASTLAFPDYDGNGTFRSLGNVKSNRHVALLFIDFERQERTLVEGEATVHTQHPLLASTPGAQLIVRVAVTRAFSCCSRYIHRMQPVELSQFAPREGHTPPTPEWKKKSKYADVLPPTGAGHRERVARFPATAEQRLSYIIDGAKDLRELVGGLHALDADLDRTCDGSPGIHAALTSRVHRLVSHVFETRSPEALLDFHHALFECLKLRYRIHDSALDLSGVFHGVYARIVKAWLTDEARSLDLTDFRQYGARRYREWFLHELESHPAADHPLYRYLQHEADFEGLKFFVAQERTVDADFADLIAQSQIGAPVAVKLSMADNYWDEMGMGVHEQTHNALFKQLLAYFQLAAVDDHEPTWSSLAGGNLLAVTSGHRSHYHLSLGCLAATEMAVPRRFQRVLEAGRRLRVPENILEYYRVHVEADAGHAEAWLDKGVIPAIAGNDALAERVAMGVRMRLRTSMDYCDMLLAAIRQGTEQRGARSAGNREAIRVASRLEPTSPLGPRAPDSTWARRVVVTA